MQTLIEPPKDAPEVAEAEAPEPDEVQETDTAVEDQDDSAPVGSAPISTDVRDEHLREIEEAELVVSQRENDWEESKLHQKSCKDAFDSAVEHLRRIIRHSGGPGPLFEQPPLVATPAEPAAEPSIERDRASLEWTESDSDTSHGEAAGKKWTAVNTAGVICVRRDNTPAMFWIEQHGDLVTTGPDDELLPPGTDLDAFVSQFKTVAEARSWCQRRDDELHALNVPPPGAPAADESWRAIPLADLTPKIGSRAMKALANHNPPLVTHGDLAAWQQKKGDFWMQDIAGLGDKGREEIEAAQMGWWQSHPVKS